MNAVEIEEAVSRLAEAPFDAENFPYAFLEAFGNKETTLKKLRSGDSNQSDLPGGVLQRNNIHLKVCADGEVSATLAGITTVRQIRENAFDIKATGRLNRLYIELLKDNPEWDTAERRSDLNHFMARLIFCYFAEDTAIFHGNGLFTATVDQMSARDSSNTHEVISELFRAMNTKLSERKTAGIRSWADGFPYVNGGLFAGSADVPVGTSKKANEDVGAPSMPDNLREAHERNDETLERIYIGRRFKNDTERLEKLFELYTQMTSGSAPTAKKVAKGKKA